MKRVLQNARAKRKVLVVEDEWINREILGNMLSEEYDVAYAENGQQAISLLQEDADSFSLILLDLMMPVMGGEEVLKICRSDTALTGIPVIVMTQDEDAEVSYFICAMLIADDLENADMEALNKAVSKLNHTSPVGVFYVDYEGGRLLYKLGVPLPSEIKEDDLYEEMNIVIGNALSIVDPALDELMGIVEGV